MCNEPPTESIPSAQQSLVICAQAAQQDKVASICS